MYHLNLALVISTAKELFKTTTSLLCPDRKGGYLCVFDTERGKPILIAEIGSVPADKIEKYFVLSQEKAERLSILHDHGASSESRDETKERWGGAVRFGKLILSFSGLSPDNVDEIYMFALGTALSLTTEGEAIVRAHHLGNKHDLKKLIKRYVAV